MPLQEVPQRSGVPVFRQRLAAPDFTGVSRQTGGLDLTWNSMPSKTYSVFTRTLSPTPIWSPLATNLSVVFPTTDYLNTDSLSGNQGFYLINYRIKQE
jgi:hypothetical protein